MLLNVVSSPNPRRRSRRYSKNIGAYVNSAPYASRSLVSDGDGNASFRSKAKIPECEHGSSDGDEETDERLYSPYPKRRKTCQSSINPL